MSSEISSEGDDEQQKEDTRKRSYECTFCKRGFTNAQALGGHMNIHRKDRAKAKQVVMPNNSCSSVSINKFSNDQYSSFQPSSRNYYSSSTTDNNIDQSQSQRNFVDMCFHQTPPSSNPIIRNYNQLPSAAAAASAPSSFIPYHHHQFHNPIRSSWTTTHPLNFNNLQQQQQDQFYSTTTAAGPNLSLQIGPSSTTDVMDNSSHDHLRRGTDQKETNEVDLELRLGHDP